MQRKLGDNYFELACPICGKTFYRTKSRLKESKIHYCSHECASIGARGSGNSQWGLKKEKSPAWKGGRRETSNGYIAIRTLTHPFRSKDCSVFEHRLVEEKYFLTDENSVYVNGKRYLSPNYVVHHKNGNKSDNRPENLEVMKKGEHSSMHTQKDKQPRDKETGRFVLRNQGKED